MARESAKAAENATQPRAIERIPRRRVRSDGCESLGQVVGAQGVLAQPEWVRGRKHTLALPLRYVGENENNVERLIRRCGCREA